MPKEMLMKMAEKLQEMSSELESYANKMEEEPEKEEESDIANEGSSHLFGEKNEGGGEKMRMAASAIRKGMSKKY